jgi:lipopolysaccharide biosynthesis glycosyltransferase
MPGVAETLAHSLQVNTLRTLDIAFLRRDALQFVREDPLASTEFTYTRFLVPWIMGYEGRALFLDNDMLCLGDIADLDDMPMNDYALRVVKHPDYVPSSGTKMDGRIQSAYPRKNWSSVMLMDCSKLRCWTREAVETMPAAWLRRFEPIPDAMIGALPWEWNALDTRLPGTNLLHYTSGGPWFQNCAQDTTEALLWKMAHRRYLESGIDLSGL